MFGAVIRGFDRTDASGGGVWGVFVLSLFCFVWISFFVCGEGVVNYASVLCVFLYCFFF